jgi:uncharacterized protein YjeT (DUF2065 family)
MAVVPAFLTVFIGLVLVTFGILALEYPQAAYRIRHWPVASSSDALTSAGEETERSLGYLWLFLGVFVCGAGVMILL